MKKGIGYIILLVSGCCLICINVSSRKPDLMNNKVINNTEPGFVVMELFTSQGCSSCPPADAILGIYAEKNDEHIISLAFHVDYWNRLGWIDSLSSSVYSQRQRDYAEKLNVESVYTPQLVINGQKQMVGSDRLRISAAVNDFLKSGPSVLISITSIRSVERKVEIDYAVNNIIPSSNINAVLVQRNIVTQIKAGENRGVKLTNYNVVRDFKTKPLTGLSGSFTLDLPAGNNADNYMVVLFVQQNAMGNIQGAVKQNCK